MVSFSTHALDCSLCSCVSNGEVNSAVFCSCGLGRDVVSYVDTNVVEGFRVKTSGLKMEAVCCLPPTKLRSSDIKLFRFYKRLLDAIRRCCIPTLVVLRFLYLVPCIILNIIQRFWNWIFSLTRVLTFFDSLGQLWPWQRFINGRSEYHVLITCIRQSQWPLGLKRSSSAARLLRLWVRIPPGAWMLSVVSVVFCQVEVSASDWSLVQGSPTDCGASLCVIKKPRKRGG